MNPVRPKCPGAGREPRCFTSAWHDYGLCQECGSERRVNRGQRVIAFHLVPAEAYQRFGPPPDWGGPHRHGYCDRCSLQLEPGGRRTCSWCRLEERANAAGHALHVPRLVPVPTTDTTRTVSLPVEVRPRRRGVNDVQLACPSFRQPVWPNTTLGWQPDLATPRGQVAIR